MPSPPSSSIFSSSSSPFTSSTLSSLFAAWQRLMGNASRTQIALATSCAIAFTAVGLPALQRLREDYGRWHGLGKGGVPHNVAGYLFVRYFGGRYGDDDVTSTARYRDEAERSALERRSFLDGPVPVRSGPRPNVSKWAAPVRQLSAAAPADVKEKLLASVQTHANSSPTLNAAPSQIEGGTHVANALFLASEGHADVGRKFATRGPLEFYHVHPSEGSAHAIVSAADARTLIEAGWSERHPLAGARRGGFPSTYLHVYAPRTDEEVEIHKMVAEAAARYHSAKEGE